MFPLQFIHIFFIIANICIITSCTFVKSQKLEKTPHSHYQNTHTWLFKNISYSGINSKSIHVDIRYPSIPLYPQFQENITSYFSWSIDAFSQKQSSGYLQPTYYADYIIKHSRDWITISFEIVIQNSSWSIQQKKKWFLLSLTDWKAYAVEDILSRRYLYTLKKESEKQITFTKNSSINPWYKHFQDISTDGQDFIFSLPNKKVVRFAMNSYFFDKFNHSMQTKKQKNVTGTGKYIALTFDDGPSKKTTPQLLDILKVENIKATFYVLWRNVDRFPDITKRAHNEWHEIGNHSYSHKNFTKLTEEEIQEEIYQTDQAILKSIGKYPRTIRHPYGSINPFVVSIGHMPSVLWSIDSRDWRTRNIQKNIASVQNARSGDIIIFHDIRQTTVDSVQQIIHNLKNRGFKFVTVSELLELHNVDDHANEICTHKNRCK